MPSMMNISDLLNVNPVLVDRIRLSVMAYLAAAQEPVTFKQLIDELELTKGNLSSHMRKLEDAELVVVEKQFVGRRPQTTYQCTAAGKQEMNDYLAAVEAVLKQAL